MLYVHIGLSKTATTSLQYAFKKNLKTIHYKGVIQPRDEPQSVFYLHFLHWVNRYHELSEHEKNKIIGLIHSDLGKSKDILISEETLCTDEEGVTWQEKLNRLQKLLSNFEYRIFITVREPFAALYSFYVERYFSLRYDYQDFDEFFHKSNQAKVYKYKFLYDYVVDEFGEDKVTFISFNEIISESGVEFNKLFPETEWLGNKEYIKVIKTNDKKTDDDGYYTKIDNFRTFLRFILPTGVPKHIERLIGKQSMSALKNKLGQYSIPFSSKKIQYPESALYNQYLIDDKAYLKLKTGIDYCSEPLDR